MILSQYILHSLQGNCLLALNLTDFLPQSIFSVVQLVIKKNTLLYKWKADFNIVITAVRPVIRKLSSEHHTNPQCDHYPGSKVLAMAGIVRESAKKKASLLTSFLNVCQTIAVTVKTQNLRVLKNFYFTWLLTLYSLPWNTSRGWHFL